jgi:hypothetical protein
LQLLLFLVLQNQQKYNLLSILGQHVPTASPKDVTWVHIL